MAQGRPERHHYVPQKYLEGFRIPQTPRVWVYERGKIPYDAHTKNVAQERYFYTPKYETHLANNVESPANVILDKIRAQQMITAEEKLIFARYLGVMLKRVPKHRERRKKHIASASATLAAEMKSKFDEDVYNKVVLPHLENIVAQANAISHPPSDIFLHLESEVMTNVLNDMTWQFLIHAEEPGFVTSDNPVTFAEGIGF